MGRKKRVVSIILIFSILLSIFMPIISRAETIDPGIVFTLDSEAKEIKQGSIITVTMNLELADGKYADTVSAYICYDNSILEFDTDTEFEPSTTTRWNIPDYVDNNGKIQIETSRGNAHVAKSGLMFTMKFKVLQTVQSTEVSIEGPINSAYLGVDAYSEGYILQIPKPTNKYEIIYNGNTTDALENMPSNDEKIEGVDYTIAQGPTRAHYIFKGWNTSADGNGTVYNAGSIYSTDENLELYAQWEKMQSTLTVKPNGGTWEGSSIDQTFKEDYGSTKTISYPTKNPNGNRIRFNANGGQTTATIETQETQFNGWTGATLNGNIYTFGENDATLTANYIGKSITLPVATKTGSTFTGWYDAQTGGNLIGLDGDLYNPTYTTENASITLFAQYTEDIYTLRINPNGGQYSGQTTVTGKYNEIITLGNITSPAGFTVTLNNEGTETIISQTKTFSGWAIVSGNGILNGNSYTFGTEDGTIIANYTENDIVLPEPTKVGYNFEGWYTQAVGGTKKPQTYKPTGNETLYAQWTPNKYTVTFEPGDGTITGDNTKEVTYDQEYGTLPTPTRPGYDFNGWKDQNGNTITDKTIVDITEDTELTAEWLGAEYTVTFDPNGGTVTPTSKTVRNEGTYGELPTPTKTGHTFKGWLNQAGQTIVSSTKVNLTADETLTAKWEANTYTVTFENDDGTVIKTQQVQHGQNAEYTGATPTKSNVPQGYSATFAGWDNEDDLKNISGNVTVTAKYTLTPNKYTVTFEPGAGTITGDNTKEVTYDQEYGTLPTPTRPGYDFNGWKDPNGNTITDKTIVNITEDTELTAEWLGAEYTVTFDPNGGTVAPTSKTVRNEGTYGELPTPTKTGHTFKGWLNQVGQTIESSTKVNLAADETLTAKWEANKHTITFNPGTNATVSETEKIVDYGNPYGTLPTPQKPGYEFEGWYKPDGTIATETDIIEGDIELTARWSGKEYTLTFDYNGGTGDTATKTIQNGQEYGQLPTANKQGHQFLGWFDDNDQKVEETDIVNVTGDQTLKAKYEINTYTVTFKNDDGTILQTIPAKYGQSIQYTGETPTKTNVTPGYEATFTGWQNAEGLSNVTEDMIITATYSISPKVYTITYKNTKDCDNSANPETYTIETEDITLVDLPNQGKYIFKGWYTTNDETGEKVTSIDTSKLGNIILHAQWENDSLYFRSEPYKVGENDIDIYQNGDIYLDKIQPDTTLVDFINNCDTNGDITVINDKNEILTDTDLVGTTMTIKVTKYDEEITMTLVVMGDINGDGKATAQDLSEEHKIVLGISQLEQSGARFKAADIDDTGKITATDLSELNKASLGISKLTYIKPKKQQ